MSERERTVTERYPGEFPGDALRELLDVVGSVKLSYVDGVWLVEYARTRRGVST